ncbi:hypothetical protein EVAR_45572_1 [Eumeta japonica]|uniref:Uncharacterized protein n=1 Tax=Eumeta variegata TaxID=151549 RepID=A0A4C1YUP0_EUMVA|nr:hypothetical protein EVAR_45572_1 [Eumeta japonica]
MLWPTWLKHGSEPARLRRYRTLTEYKRDVADSAVVFCPLSDNSGRQLASPLDILFPRKSLGSHARLPDEANMKKRMRYTSLSFRIRYDKNEPFTVAIQNYFVLPEPICCWVRNLTFSEVKGPPEKASNVKKYRDTPRALISSSLTDLISAFDTKAQTHSELQKVTAFSGHFDKNLKPTFSKDEYGKPIPGSKTELRGAEAQARVCSEMKELCQIIDEYGKAPCKSLLPPELKDATKVISFGELFTVNCFCLGMRTRQRAHCAGGRVAKDEQTSENFIL